MLPFRVGSVFSHDQRKGWQAIRGLESIMVEPGKRYLAAAINTASPGRLILLLFDGALRFMAGAIAAFEETDRTRQIEGIHHNLIKAQAILRELQTSLDREHSGEFSLRMYPLYGFMIDQLNQANLNKSVTPIRIVEGLLGQIRDAWAQMLVQTVRETT
jgi:flagellar protein FliS